MLNNDTWNNYASTMESLSNEKKMHKGIVTPIYHKKLRSQKNL